jgi:hypothetical protein
VPSSLTFHLQALQRAGLISQVRASRQLIYSADYTVMNALVGYLTDKWLAFRQAFRELESRIKIFTSLPLKSLDRVKLQERLHAIGKSRPTDDVA